MTWFHRENPALAFRFHSVTQPMPSASGILVSASDQRLRTLCIPLAHSFFSVCEGACDQRYLPTFRGFDSYEGYLAGGQGYYGHTGDRAGATPGALPACMGAGPDDVNVHNYSTSFWATAAERIITNHNKTVPLFMWVAAQLNRNATS